MTPLFRPEDRVPLVGVEPSRHRAPVFSALPDVACGESWPRVALREHRRSIEASGRRWRVADALPVHEDIKTGRGDLLRASAYYRMTLRRLASQGVKTVVYDFTPGSDRPRLANGDLPCDELRALQASYEGVGPAELAANLQRFLESIILTATVLGIGLALRPDDPSLPSLGLPRAVSTVDQIETILAAVNLPANGLCFCAGSLDARPNHEQLALARHFGSRIHAVRLEGEASPALLRVLLDEQDRRRAQGRADWRLPLRSDHADWPWGADAVVPSGLAETIRELSPSYAG